MDRVTQLIEKIEKKQAVIGVVGLGYVGLPLVMLCAERGFKVIGFDSDDAKCVSLNGGRSYIKHITDEAVGRMGGSGLFEATSDMGRLGEPDAILICVPTPLSRHREPNLAYVESTGREIGQRLRAGQLIALESTTYPGTTDEELLPILEAASGLKVGEDFFLAFSPEREDPNNPHFETATIPKVVGGVTEACGQAAAALYGQFINQVVAVSNSRVAEACKILENTYRAVNIALVNELKVLFDRMEIDVWEVVDAAKTKPFGFQAFYPGPGLGGHCIPIDPFYLTWKAREYEVPTRFIELAGEINTHMPFYVVERAAGFLNEKSKALHGSKILILGMAYKKNVDDQRESPTLKLVELFRGKGAEVDYHDPHVAHCHGHRHYPDLDMKSVDLTPENVAAYDMVLVSTDHDDVDYEMVLAHADLIVDTRNVYGVVGTRSGKVRKT